MPGAIFEDRKFILVSGGDNTDPEVTRVEEIVISNGGTITPWKDRLDGDVTPQLVVVASSTDFHYYPELSQLMVPTVTPEWVDECVLAGKLIPTRPYSPDPRNFMRKVMICCVGLSQGDTDALHAGIRAVGGDYTETLTRYTTHVISTTLFNDIALTATDSGYGIHIVSPEWIDDCIKLQVQVDDGVYRLTPGKELSDTPETNLVSTFPVRDDKPTRLAVQESVRKALGSTIFQDKVFVLGADLDISTRLKTTVVYLIETNGGRVTDELGEANVLLCKWREGEEYVQASLNRLTVGNLTWLYWMAIRQEWSPPTRHLLHYPVVKGGLPGLENVKMSITNYTGDSRAYLASLITLLGAEYSGNLSQNDTNYLVAANGTGPKYQAAKTWGINIVNHLWLEESYAKWYLQSPTLPRYTHLPSKLDMKSLIGCTHLVPKVLRQFYSEDHEPERAPLPSRAARSRANQHLHAAVLKENEFQRQKKSHALPELADESNNHSGSKRVRSELMTDAPAVSVDAPRIHESSTPEATGSPSGEDKADDKRPRNDVATTQKKPASKAKNGNGHGTKHRASTPPEDQAVRVVVTGLEKKPARTKLKAAGITLVDAIPAKIMVAPRVMRTAKFLASLAGVTAVVTPDWLDASVAAKSPVPTEEYSIKSATLQKSLLKSQELRSEGTSLFKGLLFYIDTSVQKAAATLEEIIKAHGGQISRKVTGAIRVTEDGTSGSVSKEALIAAIVDMDPAGLNA